MACEGTKISELTAASDSQDLDKYVIERSLANRSVTKRALRQGLKNESLPTQVTGELLRWSAATAYAGTVNYAPGDAVSSAGVLYICKAANGPATSVKAVSDTDYWVPDGSVVTGDWTPRSLTRAAPSEGDMPRWSSDTLNGGGAGDWVAESPRWHKISVAKYTAAPLSTSQLTMSATSDLKAGLPIKFTIASVDYYAIVTAITTNTNITIAGAPLSGTLTALYVGTPEMVHQERFYIPGSYGETADRTVAGLDPILKFNEQSFIWRRPKARLVTFSATQYTAGGDQGRLTPVIGTDVVSTENTNTGPELSAVDGTWVHNSAVAIDATKYDIQFGEALEFDYHKHASGTTGETDLNIICVFVFE